MHLQDEHESRDPASRHISRAKLSFYPPAFISPCCTNSSNSYKSLCRWMGLRPYFQQQPFLPIHLQVDGAAPALPIATIPAHPSAGGSRCNSSSCTYSRSICRWMGLHQQLHYEFLIHLQVAAIAQEAAL